MAGKIGRPARSTRRTAFFHLLFIVMISWTVSASWPLSGSYSSRFEGLYTHSSSFSSVYTAGGTNTITSTEQSAWSATYFDTSSYGTDGSFRTRSTSEEYFTSSSGETKNSETTITGSYSFSGSSSDLDTFSTGFQTASIVTSTSSTAPITITTTRTSSFTTNHYYSLLTNSNFIEGFGIALSSAKTITLPSTTSSQSTSTQTTTTQLTSTQSRPTAATVYSAESNEVLFFASHPSAEWNGYKAATDIATTATISTVYPTSSTTQLAASSTLIVSSHTNEQQTHSLSYKRLLSNTYYKTVTKVAAVGVLPFSTFTDIEVSRSTSSEQTTVTYFSSNSFTHNETYAVTSWATKPSVVSRLTGTTSYETLVASYVSTTRAIKNTILQTVDSSSSYTTSRENGPPRFPWAMTHHSIYASRTIQAASLSTVLGSPMATTMMPGPIARSKYLTRGVVDDATGGWFTIANTTLSVQTASRLRSATTLFPYSTSSISYDEENESNTSYRATTLSSNSVTYVTGSNRSQTQSALIGIEGQSQTGEDFNSSVANNVVIAHHRGGPFAAGQTALDVHAVGAYLDAIGGQTTAFYGELSTFGEANSASVRSWTPITAIIPTLVADRRNIVMTAQRNVTQLPAPVLTQMTAD